MADRHHAFQLLTRSSVGLQPHTPQKLAGRVIDPPVCEPTAATHIRMATAAAEPLLEPPGVSLQVPRVAGRGRIEAGKLGGHCLAHEHGSALRSRATRSASSSAT